MNVSNFLTKNSFSNVLTKGVGAVGLGLILYDSHVYGKIQSSAMQKEDKAESLAKSLPHEMTLERPSMVESNLKKAVFNYKLEETFSDFFSGISGYCKGFGSMLVSNVVPLGLSLGTIVSPKGILSKCFGAGLLVYGGIIFAQDILGFGKKEA